MKKVGNNKFTVCLFGFIFGLLLITNCKSQTSGGTPAAAPAKSSAKLNVASRPLAIKGHMMSAEIDPASHMIKAKDTVEVSFENPEQNKNNLFHFYLHPALELKSLTIKIGEKEKSLKARKSQIEGLQQYYFEIPANTAAKSFLTFTYEGKIFDPLQEEKSITFISGGKTSGIISEEGVYLHHGSGWYPVTEASAMMNFEVATITPKGWEVVGQNQLKERTVFTAPEDKKSKKKTEPLEKTRTVWTSPIPFDSYTLVAGKYVVNEENFNGIRIATYFSAEAQQLSKAYIDATKEYLTLFPTFLTPYPYKSFSIVENFFRTGYGMPSYTLLGKEVIMMPGHTREGGLGHEIMHCWWGNYVNVDELKGNWCEGLTTYCSNYYYLELKKTVADTINYRRNSAVKYSTYINDSNDYPVRKFMGKSVEADNEIGYDKSAMIFHMLRQLVGDKPFFDALRLVIKEKGGVKASWDDFQAAFEKTSRQSLSWYFTQWLERPGIPDLSLEKVNLLSSESKHTVAFTIRQKTEPIYQLLVPMIVTVDKGNNTLEKETRMTWINKAAESKTIDIASGKVISLAIDPEYNTLRRFNVNELTPCLGETLADKELIVICPTGGTNEENELYKKTAERIAGTSKAIIKADNEITEAELSSNSLFVLGSPQINKLASELAKKKIGDNFTLSNNGFSIRNTSFQSTNQALLASARNPYNKNKYLTFFLGLSLEAATRPARVIFFYRWDQFVIFEQGQMLRKGEFTLPLNTLEYYFAEKPIDDSLLAKKIVSIKKHCEYLASEKLQGREAGIPGDKMAADYIASEFKNYGLAPYGDRGSYIEKFDVKMQKIGKKNLLAVKVSDNNMSVFSLGRDFIPLNCSANARAEGELISMGYGITANEYKYDDYQYGSAENKIVLVKQGLPESITNTKYASSFSKALNAAKHGAKAVIIVSENFSDSNATWIEFPSEAIQQHLTPSETARTNLKLQSLILGYQSRLPERERSQSGMEIGKENPIQIPAMIVSNSTSNALMQKNGVIAIETETTFEKVLETYNVVGVIKGTSDESVIIGAHFDHLGAGSGGKYFPGANDNASGAAGLLNLAETLTKSSTKNKRSIVFAAFGGEELGLFGSRHFVTTIKEPAKTIAMLNMDMLGRGNPSEITIMGVLRSPDLYELFKKANEQLGFTFKDNIEFAYRYGSDYYSFYQAKIPNLNFTSSRFSEEHTVNDTVDKLDIEKIYNVTNLVYNTISQLVNSDIRFSAPKEVEVPFPGRGTGNPHGR